MKIPARPPQAAPRLRPAPPQPSLGDRFLRGGEGLKELALLGLGATVVPLALSAGVSALLPGWVKAGGYLANAAAGAAIGGVCGLVQGTKFGSLVNNDSFQREDGRGIGALTGILGGAVSGLAGSLASPSLGWVSASTLALGAAGWTAAATAGLGGLGLLAGFSNPPR